MRKSLDQQRAEHAWHCVQEGKTRDYKNLAKSLPALIMSNGLMQALAFLKAKGKDHHKALGAQVYGWAVKEERQNPPPSGKGFDDSVFEKMKEMTSPQYRRATEEALEILKWIRQLADAAIQDSRSKE